MIPWWWLIIAFAAGILSILGLFWLVSQNVGPLR